MAFEVLQSKSEIDVARVELCRRRLSCTSSKWVHFLRRISFSKAINVGDVVKSWDVLKTAQFIEANVKKDSSILDIGAYASEILCVLHRLGYSHLTGVDLNPDISRMPYADKIRYVVSDFMHTPFERGSFDTITSTSVIEHGFNSVALLTEASRLLRPGGFFVASFDYWPDKIDTSGVPFFGMDWKIFSRQEVLTIIDDARGYDLLPYGDINLSAGERPIECAERKYTFAWLALKKNSDGVDAWNK
jgi:SAM-dependent methyltransferase